MNLSDFAAQQSISDRDLEPYLEAKDPGRYVRSIGYYGEQVAELLFGTKGLTGDTLPWTKTHPTFRLNPGEVTLWHGINGHGKSAVTTQVAAYLALIGKRSCIGSFEMSPTRTLERMVKQVAGNPDPPEGFFGKFMLKFTPLVYIYDKRGRINPKFLFAAMRYCAAEKQVSHFFVDSLMKCVAGEDDYNGQKDFVGDLCDVAEETGLHIHLVHHVRKGEDEKRTPSKFDAKGSGAITDQVHNVIAVWRNKAKEAAKQESPTGLEDESPDFLLICDKQRTLGWEGKWALWGDRSSWHFRETHKERFSRGYDLEVA